MIDQIILLLIWVAIFYCLVVGGKVICVKYELPKIVQFIWGIMLLILLLLLVSGHTAGILPLPRFHN